MKTVYLNKVGDGGLISSYDFPTFEVGPDSINDGDNFRFKNATITRSDGWEKIPFVLTGTVFEGYKFYTGTVLNAGIGNQGMIFLLYKPEAVQPDSFTRQKRFPGEPAPRMLADVKLARWNGRMDTPLELTLIDVSPTRGLPLEYISEPQLFSFLGAVYCNMQDGAPLVYRPWRVPEGGGNIRFERMDIDYDEDPQTGYKYFPDEWRIKVLVPFWNHLVGIGYTEGTSDKNYKLVWSDIFEDADFLPDWNPKPENEAGSTILPDSFGDSFAAIPLGDNLIIYTLTTTFRLYPIGWPDIFGLEKIFPNVGCTGSNCVQEFENKHFVATLNNAYVHDGNSLKSVADGRAAKLITSLSTNFDAIGVFHNFVNREMYLYFSKTSENKYADEMLIYNYLTDQWSKANCPNVSAIITAYGLNPALTWDKMAATLTTEAIPYSDMNIDYEALKRTTANWTYYYISQQGESSVQRTTPDKYLRPATPEELIKDPLTKDPKTLITFFQRDYLDLMTGDQGQKDMGVQKYVYEMLVYMRGTGKITITVSSFMSPNGPVRERATKVIDFSDPTSGTYPAIYPSPANAPAGWNELVEFKFDFRLTGRYLSYKIQKDDNGSLEIKSIQFKYQPRGLR